MCCIVSVVVRVFVAFASGRGKNTIDDDLGECTQGWGGVMGAGPEGN